VVVGDDDARGEVVVVVDGLGVLGLVAEVLLPEEERLLLPPPPPPLLVAVVAVAACDALLVVAVAVVVVGRGIELSLDEERVEGGAVGREL